MFSKKGISRFFQDKGGYGSRILASVVTALIIGLLIFSGPAEAITLGFDVFTPIVLSWKEMMFS